MRRIRYQVASSLDGYIADADGKTDWIVHDPTIDFGELFDQFDTLLMGRLTYETTSQMMPGFFGKQVLVCSRTLRPDEHPDVEIVSDGLNQSIDRLRAEPGKDIWLFGGGALFRSLLELGLVDTIEPAIVPVVLGAGHPLVLGPALERALTLTGHRVFPSGIVWLEYEIGRAATATKPSG